MLLDEIWRFYLPLFRMSNIVCFKFGTFLRNGIHLRDLITLLPGITRNFSNGTTCFCFPVRVTLSDKIIFSVDTTSAFLQCTVAQLFIISIFIHQHIGRTCWTTAVEQPSVKPATVRPYPSSVPPGVKDVFVWLTGTPAPSDFCFFSVIYKCSYLPTYLFTYKNT